MDEKIAIDTGSNQNSNDQADDFTSPKIAGRYSANPFGNSLRKTYDPHSSRDLMPFEKNLSLKITPDQSTASLLYPASRRVETDEEDFNANRFSNLGLNFN